MVQGTVIVVRSCRKPTANGGAASRRGNRVAIGQDAYDSASQQQHRPRVHAVATPVR